MTFSNTINNKTLRLYLLGRKTFSNKKKILLNRKYNYSLVSDYLVSCMKS